ncbi:MAG: hypothetical protein NDI60_04925 [Elusimicrobiales bacterium]|nr:hypothetical protein [Elusimicrobiales bacterium]
MKNRGKLAALLLAGALLAPAALCRAQQAVSTAAPTQTQSPLILNISKDSYSSRVGLDYSIRWDFSDIASFRPSLGAVYSGLKAVTSWDITENTRVNYYGFRTNPWRVIITKEKKTQPYAGAESPAGAEGAVVSAPQGYRKRVRFSVSPLVDDLKRNFDDGLRDFLLRSSLSGVSPQWEKAGDAGRKAFVNDVLSLEIWGTPLPGVKQTKEGLEYISK